jgi:hypothetical protein
VPSRVAFFVWTVALGKILTIDNLSQHHIVVLNWVVCATVMESLLIISCFIALLLMRCGLCLLGCLVFLGLCLLSVLGLLDCWQGRFGRQRNLRVWRAVPHCLMWSLWRERNGCSFEDSEQTIVELKLLFLRTLCDWVSARGSVSCVFTLVFGLLLALSLICLLSQHTGLSFSASIKFYYFSKKKKSTVVEIKVHIQRFGLFKTRDYVLGKSTQTVLSVVCT